MASEEDLERSPAERLNCEENENSTNEQLESGATGNSPIQFVNITKSEDEPLGITLALTEYDDIIISRILKDSLTDRQGLLREGDIIREVDDVPMQTPDQVIKVIGNAKESFKLTIVQSYKETKEAKPIYMKAHFSYDPMKDGLIPCKEAGLAFKDGDILEIVNSEGNDWWQARHAGKNGITGLIPAKVLEEKRKAYIKPHVEDSTTSSLLCGLGSRRKKKYKYTTRANADFDGGDVMVYEEVTKVPGFRRGLIILVGADGVGKRSLKERLIREEPKRFKGPTFHTSRSPRKNELNGANYYFTDREKMEDDIGDHKYVEYGIYKRHLYGIRLETICKIMNSGKTCVQDVNPMFLKELKTPQFMAYVVFIAAPSADVLKEMYEEGKSARKKDRKKRRADRRRREQPRTDKDFIETVEQSALMEQSFKSYFDTIIVNDSFEETYSTLRKTISSLSKKDQWIPVSWVYK